jgi:hypothetical protein
MGLPPLNLRLEVDTTPLEQIAAASQITGTATAQLAEKFATLASATSTGKQRAYEWVAAQNAAEAAAKSVAASVDVESVSVTGLDRAMTVASAKITGSLVPGMGMMAGGLGRVAAQSATLAPILSAAFPAMLGVAFVEMAARAVESFQKWNNLGEETVHKLDDQTLSLRAGNDELDVTNARLAIQIAKLEHKPADYLALALAEDRKRADDLSKALGDALQKTVQLLEAGPGLASEFFLGKGNVAEVGARLAPLEREYQLAQLANDPVAQKNILLKEQKILQDALNYEQAKATTLTPVGTGAGAHMARGVTDSDAANAYKSALAGVGEQLNRIKKDEQDAADDTRLANDEKAKSARDAADKEADEQTELAAYSKKLLDQDVADYQKYWEAKVKADLHGAIEAKEAADKLHAEEKKENAAAVKEMTDTYTDSWKTAIQTQGEDFRSGQKLAEQQLRAPQAAAQVAGAGMPQSIKMGIDAEATNKQIALASGFLQDAQAKAAAYNVELAQLGLQMAQVAADTGTDSTAYKKLETDLEALKRLYDQAADASQKWSNVLTGLNAKLKEQSNWNFGAAIANSMQSAFNSFNSNLMRMQTGGMSFAHVMQKAWTSMAESFETDVLKMGEQWAMMELRKLALTAAGEQASTDITLSQNMIKRFDDAKTAAANAMANIPTPLNFIMAPIVFAATLSFAQGGIVPANLHEGEMVLPRNLSAFVQSSAAAAGARGEQGMPGTPAGRPINFHYHATVNSATTEGVSDLLSNHGEQMFRYFKGRLRKMGINS